jgi:protein arginine kinase
MTIDDLLLSPGEWLKTGGALGDVVVSSRIRLARNLNGFHFLPKASAAERKDIARILVEAIASSEFGKETFYVDIEKADPLDRQFLVERQLISRQHGESEGSRGVAVSPSERLSLMINEEDHLRIQILRHGMDLDDAWNEMARVDAALESSVDFAFHEQYGYLTACPTNVGTGLRVSVMLHLPGLKITNEIEKVLRAAKDMRLAVRGLYGEGTEALGDFFQVSNQLTLGRTEQEILSDFKENVIPSVVKYEQETRKALKRDKLVALDDKIWRAYGILANARAISSEETLFLLSHLRMGVLLERITHLDLGVINDLFLSTQSAHLQKRYGKRLDVEQRSIIRADYIRERITRAQPSTN